MSLAETGALDDNILTTKNLIANASSPVDSDLSKPDDEVVSIPNVNMDEVDASITRTQHKPTRLKMA